MMYANLWALCGALRCSALVLQHFTAKLNKKLKNNVKCSKKREIMRILIISRFLPHLTFFHVFHVSRFT